MLPHLQHVMHKKGVLSFIMSIPEGESKLKLASQLEEDWARHFVSCYCYPKLTLPPQLGTSLSPCVTCKQLSGI